MASSVTVTVYIPTTSGVKSGLWLVASIKAAVDPPGAVSAQSYDACSLPCSSTGMLVGMFDRPEATFHRRVV